MLETGIAATDAGPTPAAVPTTIEELFHSAYAPMVRLASLLTGSNETAEDVVQDCFARMQRKWKKVDHPAAYLRTSVVNACKSWHRSRVREERRMHRVSAGADAEVTLDADELLDAVGKLPYQQRAALVLRYYEHCSEAEIADALGCPRNTVKSHLRRGLAALRQVVEQ